MVAEFTKKHPSTIQETINWLLRLGRPPLPECPIEAAKQGKEPKQPCFLDGKRVIPVSWKQWQKQQPITEIYQTWFTSPKTGIGTLGGWNGKHWLGWVDFDKQDFSSADECDRAIDQWVKQYPIVANAPMFRTPGGGYRFLVAFSQEPQNFKANSGFSLNPDGSHHVGELLTKNGGHTLLPPTIGVSGKSYQWVQWSEYPPVVEQPEDVGLYPVQKQTGNNSIPTLPAKQGSSSKNTDTSLIEFLERDVYFRLTEDIAFGWPGHDFKPSGNKLKGNCPWHESQSGTAFYVEKKDDRFLWRCPACNIGGTVIEYRHRLAGGNGSPRGKDFVEIVQQLADDVGLPMPIYKSQETKERSEPTNNKFSKGSSNTLSISSVSLRERLAEILNRDHAASERKAAIIELAGSTGRQVRELEQLAEAIESENDLREGRTERAEELNRLLKLGDRRLTLSRYLHPYLAQPLERLSCWLGVDVEALLTVLLPTAASLLHPETRVIVKECSNFVEPLVFYTGIVSESGNRKSPLINGILERLWKLQSEEDIRNEEAQQEYKKELAAWKQNKSKDKGEQPEPPLPAREYFVNDITTEALDTIKAQQPGHGILIYKDELSGLFASYGAYKGGRGADREGVLSGWNGGGIKKNRASGTRLSLSHDASSIVGAIQPGKLRELMGDLQDDQGQWARFLWYYQPLKALRLPNDDGKFVVGELLEGIYRKLNNLAPIRYRFASDAQSYYDNWHWELEQRKLAETRQGMRAASAKMQGYTARLAGILHILWSVVSGETPSSYIPLERVKAARSLSEFYLGQVQLIHSDAEAAQGELTPLLGKILGKAQQVGKLSTRIAKSSIKALKKLKSDEILEHFRELVAMGYAKLEGKTLIPNIVDPMLTKMLTAAATTTTTANAALQPLQTENVDQNVDQMLTTPTLAATTITASLQPLQLENVDHVDHVDQFLEKEQSIFEQAQHNLSAVVEPESSHEGQQVNMVNKSTESPIQSGVADVDRESTNRSTFLDESTFSDEPVLTVQQSQQPNFESGSSCLGEGLNISNVPSTHQKTLSGASSVLSPSNLAAHILQCQTWVAAVEAMDAVAKEAGFQRQIVYSSMLKHLRPDDDRQHLVHLLATHVQQFPDDHDAYEWLPEKSKKLKEKALALASYEQ